MTNRRHIPLRRTLLLLAVTAVTVAFAAGARYQPTTEDDPAYWVWRWSDLALVEPGSTLLLYQGDFHSNGERPLFVKHGVDPFALPGRDEIGLLIRLYDIADADAFAEQAAYLVRQWQHRAVEITEIQLDYDCPSNRLDDYNHFIAQVRAALDRNGINTALSITGLLTWNTDDSTALDGLAESVTYIAFQLYDRHEPLANVDAYFASLSQFKHPYKVGISTSDKFDRMEYPQNDNYLGKLVFLNVIN